MSRNPVVVVAVALLLSACGLSQGTAVAGDPGTKPPSITQQPRSLMRYVGRTAVFSVSVAGTNLTYQWKFLGNDIPDATNNTFAITSVSLADAGRYRAIVSNSTGSTASAEAILTVVEPAAGTYEAAVLAANPLAYWRLGERSGSVAFDAWGGFDGTYSHVSLGASGPLMGDTNTAVAFNGVNSAITTPLSLNGLPAFTIVGWFKRSGDLSNRAGLWGQNDLVEVGYITNHILQASTGASLELGPNPIPNGQWVQLAVVSDGSPGVLRIYTNGVSAVSQSHSLPPDNSSTFNIGGGGIFDPTGNSFYGRIDEVAVFGHALSTQQITNLLFARGYAPIAICRRVTKVVCAGCVASVLPIEVDNGSFDPDGTIVARSLVPPGPYPPGTNSVRLFVTDNQGIMDSCGATIIVREQFPPIATLSPAVTNVPLGASVNFCLSITGIGPFEIQWRHNGVVIPNATNACLLIPSVGLADGGDYTAIVANAAGLTTAGPAQLLLDLPKVQGTDSLTNRTLVDGATGLISGTNNAAAADPGEPRHFGKPGGKSVWYEWSSAETGIATFSTLGSSFDTLLAVYVQCGESNLVEVASDDDGDSNLTSRVRFNVIAGTNYLIAIDGFAGADGQFALNWEFEAVPLLPVISAHPQNLTVAPGDPAVFSVTAAAGCEGCSLCGPEASIPTVLQYQWYRHGVPIDGATDSTYAISSVQESDVGVYAVDVTESGRTIRSHPAVLQLNLTGSETQPVQAHNKFEDAAESPGIELGGMFLGPPPPPEAGTAMSAAVPTVVRGYTGTQVFSTSGSTAEPGDQSVCGVIGGASQWLTFAPLQSGVLHLNTDGSSYNTVMAVFTRSPTNAAVLRLVDCDNNGGIDGRDSALSVPVQAGNTNFVMIDGVNGQTGNLRVNYSLVVASAITLLGTTPEGHPRLRITGRPELHFVLQVSTNTSGWNPLITTNSLTGSLDYVDTTTPLGTQRLYRALMLP